MKLSRIVLALCACAALCAVTTAARAAIVDVSGAITNPNSTIGVGNTANMLGNTTFGWQTGNCAIPVQTNGFSFTLDSGNGNPLNYSGFISGAGDVHFRMAPSWSGLANNPMILSGATSNTYTGTSYVEYGRVQMEKTGGATAIAGNIVVGGQGNNDRLRWNAANQVADTSVVTLLNSFVATVDMNGFADTIGTLQLGSQGVVDTGAGGALTTGSLNFNGVWLPAGAYTSGSQSFIAGSGSVQVLGLAAPSGDRVGLNFAGASNNPGGRKALASGTMAGPPGLAQDHWNNTPGTAQTGTPSSANDTLSNLLDNKGFATSIDITFTSPQTWGFNFGASPTGDQQLNGNGITDGTPTVTVSQIPYSQYDVVAYIGMYAPGRNSTYQLDDGTTVYQRFALVPDWADFATTGWDEISDQAISAALRETGNFTVFHGLTASSFTLSSVGGGGVNAIQIINTTVVPEPSTFVLAGLGLLGLAGLAWRRRRAK